MTARITVVTAAHEPNFQYLDTAYQSLLDQDVLDWEWVVQVDGEGVPSLPKDKRVHTANNRPSGPGATRNMALAHATAPVVRTLDADDALLPGACVGTLTPSTNTPRSAGAFLLLSTFTPMAPRVGGTGTTPLRGSSSGLGRAAVGLQRMGAPCAALHDGDATQSPDGRGRLDGSPHQRGHRPPPRRRSLAPGWFHSEPGNLYRKHADQLTKSIDHLDPATSEQRHRLILERVAELRRILR